MKQRTRIPRKRATPRRKRPELFHRRPQPDPWPAISLRMRLKWWEETEGFPVCGICGEPITSFVHLVPDHREPGKMGGCKDHSESNLQPSHWWCNREKGSKRNYTKVSA